LTEKAEKVGKYSQVWELPVMIHSTNLVKYQNLHGSVPNYLLIRVVLAWLALGMSAPAQWSRRGEDVDLDPEQAAIADAHSFDFVRREEMIPMRDGVKLYTIILIPEAEEQMPMLLTRTPYGASQSSSPEQGRHLESALHSGDDIFADAGYIRVFQDIRGRHRSEGEYIINRPLRGPLNSTDVDHSTDAYDTIEWLLENIPESNRRVGMIGTSYDGFLVLMGLVNPHPALKAAVAVNPMVDTWIGDDWFHNGAFRQAAMDFLCTQLMPGNSQKIVGRNANDDFEFFLKAGSAGNAARLLGITELEFWHQLLMHPSYDSYWQSQAMDKILAARALTVPTLYVHGLWDQEDIYGAIAAYRATEPKDTENDRNFLVIGPWKHGGASEDGYSLGPLRFNGPTGRYFRRNILLPFLDGKLKDTANEANTPPVLAYETGTNIWRRYEAWPLSCESGCPHKMQPLFFQPGFRLAFEPVCNKGANYDEYLSDPLNPVPYRRRPILPIYARNSSWGQWLVDDQRFFSDREDVLSYRSDPLTQPIAISGNPIADLFASTTGTDSDFVVKLIDVYPDEYPAQPEMAGYQLMISADILRGRYRKDKASPSPIPEGKIERFRWALPASNHVFLPEHRIMIQIQSSWFPLYDRNPQEYVKNIFVAGRQDFHKAKQRIYHSELQASSIILPISR
jgi:putative CocE/NonD family hydrolase